MGQPSTGMYAGPYPGHAGGRGGVRHAAAPLAAAALKGAHTQTPYAAFLQHASHAAPLQRMPEGFYQPRVDSRSGFRDLSSDAELHPSSHPSSINAGRRRRCVSFPALRLHPVGCPRCQKPLLGPTSCITAQMSFVTLVCDSTTSLRARAVSHSYSHTHYARNSHRRVAILASTSARTLGLENSSLRFTEPTLRTDRRGSLRFGRMFLDRMAAACDRRLARRISWRGF